METERRICRYLGCQRPAAASKSGTGRPPGYCDDSAHNRIAAWHARRRLRGEQSGRVAGVERGLVDAARQPASELHGQVAGMIEHLGQQLQALLEELWAVADPEAAELQIEAVTSQAAEQVATAAARASRAALAQLRAETERAEADAAAEEASALSVQLRTELEQARQRPDEAEAQRDRLITELADVHAGVDAQRQEFAASWPSFRKAGRRRGAARRGTRRPGHLDQTGRSRITGNPRPRNALGTLSSGPTPSRRAPRWRRTGLSRHAVTWRKPTGKRRSAATRSVSCARSWRR